MGFNEKGEIIRKSGPQRQTQIESQRPAPSKFDQLQIIAFEYGFFDILKIIAYGTAGVLGLIFYIYLFALCSWFFLEIMKINDIVGNLLSIYIIVASCVGSGNFLGKITYGFERKLLDFLNKRSGSALILFALWDTIFFALVFWFFHKGLYPIKLLQWMLHQLGLFISLWSFIPLD